MKTWREREKGEMAISVKTNNFREDDVKKEDKEKLATCSFRMSQEEFKREGEYQMEGGVEKSKGS